MTKLRILVIGKGGREHALVWKLMQSGRVEIVYAAPGNPGIAAEGVHCIPPVFCNNIDLLIALAKTACINLVVIQQDDALAAGWSDRFRKEGFNVFGPSRLAAQIEWSKSFAKRLMKEVGIPTASFEVFTNENLLKAQAYISSANRPLVIKADGLALGKGVRVCSTAEEALVALDELMIQKVVKSAGETVVIEERLEGEELSIHALSDGNDVILFPPSRDHKQLLDGGKGPMTGGMGVFGPIEIDDELMEDIKHTIILPCIRELKRRETPFRGLLYAGLMITKDGPMVLEFNSRFGDPETQHYMMRLGEDVDLATIFEEVADGTISGVRLDWRPFPCFAITLAASGYPGPPEKGVPIRFMNPQHCVVPPGTTHETKVFHCGTAMKNGELVTDGGRVLTVTTLVKTDKYRKDQWGYLPLNDGTVFFKNMQFRQDIGCELPK